MSLHTTHNRRGLHPSEATQVNCIAQNIAQQPLPGSHHQTLRVALYSHDTMGLGHARRNLLLAQAISESRENVDILLITGNRETSNFSMPKGTDCLTMPSVHKSSDGSYRSRRMGLPLPELISLRSGLIHSALETFQPDVLIVDNVPRGVASELDRALEAIRQRGATRCILGLRDVLDSPSTVRWEWARSGNYDAIRRYYDQVWVFGDQAVYNPVVEYGLPEDITEKFRFAGYLDQCARLSIAGNDARDPLEQFNFLPGELAVCLVGGGQDGAKLAQVFARTSLPEGMNGVILTGPFMPQELRAELYQLATTNERMGVLDFLPEPGVLLARASRVVAMGGYNTVCEVLSHNKRALIVPRVRPREEQLIRAVRMSALGLFTMCHPDNLNPGGLADWLAQTDPAPNHRITVDLQGIQRVPLLLDGVLRNTIKPLRNFSGEEQHHVTAI